MSRPVKTILTVTGIVLAVLVALHVFAAPLRVAARAHPRTLTSRHDRGRWRCATFVTPGVRSARRRSSRRLSSPRWRSASARTPWCFRGSRSCDGNHCPRSRMPRRSTRSSRARTEASTWVRSWLDYRDLASRLTSFAWLEAFRMTPLTVGEAPGISRAAGLLVSGGYFRALGLTPAAGRLLEAGDALAPGGRAGGGALVRLLARALRRRAVRPSAAPCVSTTSSSPWSASLPGAFKGRRWDSPSTSGCPRRWRRW